jgi:hypothetical protein
MNTSIQVGTEDHARLQRQLQQLQWGLVIAFVLIVLLGIWLWIVTAANTDPPDQIRTRGIAIIDEQGRDRILIGAPVPQSDHRKRKDAATDSIVFVSADGTDQLIVGTAPGGSREGKTSERIAQAVGLVLHDPQGNERGGVVFLDNGRAAVVLDRASPAADAVALMVDDKTDFAGLLMIYPGPFANSKPAFKMGTTGQEAILQMFDASGAPRSELKVSGTEQPQWKLDKD